MVSFQAQSQEVTPKQVKKAKTDSIIMPREEFVNLLANAIKKRRYEVNQLLLKFGDKKQTKEVEKLTHIETDKERISKLEDKLHQLMLVLIQQNAANQVVASNYTLPFQDTEEKVEEFTEKTTRNPETGRVDTVKTKTEIVVDNSSLSREIEKLAALRKQMKTRTPKVEKSPYAEQVFSVFFANNKHNLSAEGIAIVSEIIKILKSDRGLEVMIKGFSSKLGNSLYNLELSLKRADVVKQAFISSGITPGRVLTTYHGEDFSNKSEAEARRVDIIILDSRK